MAPSVALIESSISDREKWEREKLIMSLLLIRALRPVRILSFIVMASICSAEFRLHSTFAQGSSQASSQGYNPASSQSADVDSETNAQVALKKGIA